MCVLRCPFELRSVLLNSTRVYSACLRGGWHYHRPAYQCVPVVSILARYYGELPAKPIYQFSAGGKKTTIGINNKKLQKINFNRISKIDPLDKKYQKGYRNQKQCDSEVPVGDCKKLS